MRASILAASLILTFAFTCFGQTMGMPHRYPQMENRRTNEQVLYELANEKELEKKRQKVRDFVAEINETFSAPEEYRQKYSKYLDGKKAGLMRMFPDRKCGEGLSADVQELERCAGLPPIKGAGSLYTFRLSELEDITDVEWLKSYFGDSDIHFVDGKFIVGNDHIQDIITDIGDVALDDVTTKSEVVKFLNKWKSSRNILQFDVQRSMLEQGIKRDGYFYSNSTAVKLNTTYVLRSIAYGKRTRTAIWTNDQLAAFRIVGQENDGSIVMIWKILKENYRTPFLETGKMLRSN